MLSSNTTQAPPAEDEDIETLPESTSDEATAPQCAECLTCTQSVVYSPTFQVPAFYFTMHHNSRFPRHVGCLRHCPTTSTDGSPLSLAEIMTTSLLRRHAVPPAEATTFALTENGAAFPLLSQGDHPVLGTPAWYFHPCHTQEAVGELLSEVEQEDWTEEERLVRWIEVWFMVVGQIVDLKYEVS